MARRNQRTENATSGNPANVDGNENPNDNVNGHPAVDPATAFGDGNASGDGDSNNGGTGEPPRRKRGRPPGSKSRRSGETQDKIDLSGLESILLSIHTMLHAMTQAPEWALEPAEAKSLADATSRVARHYEIAGLDQKTVDWGNLFVALGSVYGSRVFAFRLRKQGERGTQPRPAPRVVNPATDANASATEQARPPSGKPYVIPGVGPAVGGL